MAFPAVTAPILRPILQPHLDAVGARPLAGHRAASQGAPWTAGGGGGDGTTALVEDRGRPQRL
jgi:hypothetical protein